MSMDYRIFVNVILTLINASFLFWGGFDRFCIIKKSRRYPWEFAMGYTLVAALALQFINKVATGSIIFMLNPCHVCAVV
jgi:hypothetical protein